MKKSLAVLAYCLLLTAYCLAQLPESDIWLLDIKDSSGIISLVNPVNITNRKGYDNQPAFSPDGKYILYSSVAEGTQQTDILKYDLATKTSTPFIQTPTSEYSPTFMPDGKNISVVMVEKDSTQRLWKFPIAGGAPSCIMPNIKEVGYHTWINKDSVALFILTKPSFTIQLVNVATQKATVIADSVGRCMRMKDRVLWYTTKSGIVINVFEYHPKAKAPLWKGEIESEDYCFYKKDIWSCSENSIVSGYMNSKLGAVEVANLEAYGIKRITRITLSPDGKKIAVVSNK
jgi:dipeptidyl aminopeptidase/acylaminoacyl peptidase